MKLHLPSGLRKALLACLAAVALPAASFPSTLASASGIAAVFLVANQRAYAEFTESDGVSALAEGGDLTIEEEQTSSTLSADETYEDFVIKTSTSNDGTGLKLSGHTATITGKLKEEGEEGFDLRVNGGGTLALWNGGALTGTFAAFDRADIKLGKEGTDNATLSVGKLGGNGFSFSAAGENEVTLRITTGDENGGALGQSASYGGHSTFNDHVAVDLSESITQRFSGVEFLNGSKLKINSGSTVEFTNVAWGDNVSLFAGELEGSGTLKVDGAGVGHNPYTDTEQDQKHRLEWSGTTSATFQQNGTLDLGANGIFKMSTDFSASKVTLAAGSTIQLTSGTLKAATLELGENTATLEITLMENNNTQLSFSSITQSGEGKLTIKLIGWEGFAEAGYQLFDSGDGQWSTLWEDIENTWQDIFKFQDEDGFDLDGVKLTDKGKLNFEALAAGYIYDGTQDLIWDTSTSSNTGWQTDQKYTDNASVEFTATEGDYAVEVGSDVVARNLQVTGAAHYNITSSSDGDVYTLTVRSKMEVAGGAKLTFSKDVQLKLEGVASLTEGSTLIMSGNIDLGSTGSLTGAGNVERGEGVDQVYVQFQVNGDGNITEMVDAWVTGKLGDVKLGEGVELQKRGEETLTFKTSSDLACDLDIDEGAVKFDTGSFTVSGALTGKGTLVIATAHGRGTVTLSRGANMTGDLALSCYAASLALGGDATFGGLVNDGTNFAYLDTDNREHIIKKASDTSDGVTLTLNVTSGEKEAKGVNIAADVKVVKDGVGTQKFTEVADTTNGRVTLAGEIEVKAGVLEITGEHSTISGALSGEGAEGTLRLASGNLEISGGGTHGGTLELTAGTITVSGENTLEVGTFKAVAGVLDLRTNFTVNNMSLAADSIVQMNGNTLFVTNDLTLDKGKLMATGEGELIVGGGLTINAGSHTVSDGNLEVRGELTMDCGIAHLIGIGLSVPNGILKLHHGLMCTNWSPSINAATVEFFNDNEADYDGNFSAKNVIMNGTGSQSLHRGKNGFFDVSGNVTVMQGTLEAKTEAEMKARIDGQLNVQGGVFKWTGNCTYNRYATMTVGSISQTGGEIKTTGNLIVTGEGGIAVNGGVMSLEHGAEVIHDVTISTEAANFSVGGELSVGGHLNANGAALNLKEGGKLKLLSGSVSENHLGSLNLSADAAIEFLFTAHGHTALAINTLNAGNHSLTITLTGLGEYLAAAERTELSGGWELDLFGVKNNDDLKSTLSELENEGKLTWVDEEGYSIQMQEDGTILVVEDDVQPRVMGRSGLRRYGSMLMTANNDALAAAEAISIASGTSYTVGDAQNTAVEAPSLTLTGSGDAAVVFGAVDNTLTIAGQVTGEEGVNLRVCTDQNHSKGTIIFEQGGTIAGSINVFDLATITIGKADVSDVTLSVGNIGGNGFNYTAAGTDGATLKVTVGAIEEGDAGANVAKGQSGKHGKIGANVTLELESSVTQLVSGVDFEEGSHVKLGESSVLKFMNGSWGDTTSSFAGELDGTGKLQVVGGTAAGISGTHTLDWTGTTSTSFQSNGTLDLENLGVFKMSKDFTAKTVTLATGSTIRLTSGTLKAATLELGENTATLEITLTGNNNTQLSFSSITQSGEGKLTIKLIGWEEFAEAGYQLFAGDDDQWTELWESIQGTWQGIFDFQDGDGVNLEGVQLTSEGKLDFGELAAGYVYDGTQELIWTSTPDGTGWQGDQEYRDGASVKFTATEGDHAVKVGSDVVARNLQVTGAAHYNITSSVEGTAHTLTVMSQMEVPERAKLTFSRDVKLKLEGVASLAEGSELIMSSNIDLGSAGRLTGAGNIEKGDVDQVYVQFQVGGDENIAKTVDGWVTEKLGSVKLGEGVGLQKTGTGTLSFADTGGTLQYDFDIDDGAVQFNGNSYTLEGKLTGKGNFNVATAAVGNENTGNTLTMKNGGVISGDMALSVWGARLKLEADLEVGGITKLAGDNLVTGQSRFRTVLSDSSTNLTVNVAGGDSTKVVDGLQIEKDVTLVKKGAGTQKFTTSTTISEGNGTTQLKGSVQVDEGVLEFEGEGSVISGALSNTDDATGGTLKLTSGDLTLSGGGKHGGTLELTEGKITVSGAALEVGTFKATTGELDVQSNLTIGDVERGSELTTLRIESDTRVAVKGGTLKAGTLDLTGTTGASLEVGMDGGAALDFGEITPGKDGKLTIEMTGYGGERSYQLFEEKTFGSVWDSLVTGKEWDEVFDITITGTDMELKLESNGQLTIRPRGIDWSGGSDDTWSDEQPGEWAEGTVPPTGRDVTFAAEAAEEGHGDVKIEGTVRPRNVHVKSGEYTFTQKEGTTGGLDMSEYEADEGGTLRVGGGEKEAKLTLALANTSIREVILGEQGTLVLANDQALTGETVIKFGGGVLEYSAYNGGTLKEENLDVSRRVVNNRGGSTGAVKVSVDAEAYADGVVWGGAKEDMASNGGLWHAVHESENQGGGMEKCGTGKLTLEWQETETETGEPTTHRGSITVKKGELQYKIHTAGAADVTMRGGVTVKKAGTFTLSVYGGGIVEYIEALNGEGTVSLGGEDGEGTVKLSGDSSGFKGTVSITAGTVEVSNGNALGGGEATLELSGGNLDGSGVTINAGTVVVSGGDAVLSGVTLAGKVTGGSGLTAKDGTTVGLSGDISGYKGGELKTGGSGTWKLSDKALSQPVGVAVSGSGVVEFAGDAIYSGKVSDSVTLRGSSGMLTIVTEGSSDGAKLAGNVTLGKAGTKAVWGGREAVDGTITLANVELSNDGGFTIKNGAKLCVTTAAADEGGSSIVDVNGMRGERLDDITINQHGELCNITGKYTANSTHHLALHFSAENVGDAVDDLAALITGREGGKFELDASNKDDVDLLLETDALASIVGRLAAASSDKTVDVYLRLVGDEDTLTMRGIGLDHLLDVLDGDSAGILSSLYIESVSVEKGCIKLTGSAADVYVAPKGNSVLTDGDREQLNKAGATVLANPGDHLTLSMDGGTSQPEEGPDVTVRNLLGVTGSQQNPTQLSLKNSSKTDPTGANRLEVAFNNTHSSTLANADKYSDEIDGTTVYGQDTTFNGSIDGGAGVDVEKQGLGTLTVGGGYKLADGTTTLTAGALRLRDAENSMRNLVFSYTGAPKTNGKQGADGETKAEERGLLLEGGVTTITGSIKDEENEGKGNDIVMSRGAELVLKGATTLNSTGIIGDEKDGGGKLTLDGAGAGLTLGAKIDENGKVTGAAQLSGVDVRLTNEGNLTIGEKAGMDVGKVELGEGGTLDIGSGKANHVDFLNSITEEDITDGTGNGTLRSAADNGTLKSAGGGELHVGGGTFSGTLGMREGATSAGTLVVDSGAEFTLDNVTTDKTKGWGVTLNGGSTLTVDVSEGKGAYFGDINLGNGKMMFNFGEQNPEQNSLSGTITEVGEKGTLDFFSVGKVENSQEGKWEWKTGIIVAESLRDSFADHVTFTGEGSFLEDSKASVDKDTGALTVTTEAAKDNKFERLLPDMSKNARAGATMVWDSLKEKSQDEAFFNALMNPTSDYDRMASALIGLYDNGDKEGLEKALVAVAGSSVSVLGPAVVEDLHRQLTTMRNRTTMTTNEQHLEQYDVYPMWHAWLNAEGAYRKLDADGFAPGYTLNSWGGTVGVDSDVSERTIVGLALTAMYGDLKTDGADVGKGDLDTMYFSAFARTTRGAWSHTFVVSGGIADVSLDRTVNAGGVSYRTQGSTDGYAVGALYEVGYTKLMNRRGTIAFQPVFNVEIRHAAIKGYTETGSNAGLKADDIEQDVVTFGVGARMQSIVGENAYNRASILEARLLVKGDVGDRSGVAKNALTGSTSVGEVESAEVGAFGVEAGVGLTVPLGSQMGNLFIDGSMELRKGQTGFDATLGYRISF